MSDRDGIEAGLIEALRPLIGALRPLVAELVREEVGRLAPPEPSPYLTVAEAADYLRAKPQRIYDLFSDGRLTRYGTPGARLVSRSELERRIRDGGGYG